jgi:hypothetical protein
MNFTHRNQRNTINNERNEKNYIRRENRPYNNKDERGYSKQYKNPFLKNNQKRESQEDNNNLSTKQVNINDIEEFPALPSTKKTVSQTPPTPNNWAL